MNTIPVSTFTKAVSPPARPMRMNSKWRLGFNNGRSLASFAVLGSIMVAFCLFHLTTIPAEGMKNNIGPGEWFWFKEKWYQRGLQLHLLTCLPAGFLSVFQFIPNLRNAYRYVHRLNGRVIFTLLYLTLVGSSVVSPRSYGGSFSTQSWSWSITAMSSVAIYESWTAIRQPIPNVVEHRKWAFRTMFWMCSIVTARVVMMLGVFLGTRIGSYYTVLRCDEIEFTMEMFNETAEFATQYGPVCQGYAPSTPVPVLAGLNSIMEFVSALRWTFGGSLWLSLIIHVLGVEYYLQSSSPVQKKV